MKQLNFVFIFGCIALHNPFNVLPFPPIGHSHNDYHQKRPFKTAIDAGMKSIEADVFLHKDALYVGHTSWELKHAHTLSALYLQPIAEAVCNGKPYPTELLIDVKTEAKSTLNAIIKALNEYPDVFNAQSAIKIVISGNRPKPCEWEKLPPYILFDGRPNENYTDCELNSVYIISDNFRHYKGFRFGKYKLHKLANTIQKVHSEGKMIRFWKTHDSESTWKRLAKLGVDVINTDKPLVLKRFLDKK